MCEHYDGENCGCERIKDRTTRLLLMALDAIDGKAPLNRKDRHKLVRVACDGYRGKSPQSAHVVAFTHMASERRSFMRDQYALREYYPGLWPGNVKVFGRRMAKELAVAKAMRRTAGKWLP